MSTITHHELHSDQSIDFSKVAGESEALGRGVDATVLDAQFALVSQGYDVGTIDGEWGDGTSAAVSAFQTANGLPADGIIGRETGDALGLRLLPQ